MSLRAFLMAAVVAALVLYVAALSLAESPFSSPWRVVQALSGLFLIVFGPGCLFVAAMAPPRIESLFPFLALGFGGNALLLIVTTTLIKATGIPITRATLLIDLGALTAIGATACLLQRQPAKVGSGLVTRALVMAALALIVPVSLLAVSKPFLAEDDQYLPLDTLRRLPAKDGPAETRRLVSTWPDVRWLPTADPLQFRVETGESTLAWFNDRDRDVTLNLCLVVQAYGEGELSFRRADTKKPGFSGETRFLDSLNETFHVQPRFDAREHPRNFPPPSFIIARDLSLKPGQSSLRINYKSSAANAYLLITDLSGLGRVSFAQEFGKRFLVDNVGDRQSNIELARNLRTRLWLFEHSYDGTRHDGGGYTISNLPFPYFLYDFALLLLGDSVSSIHLLYLAELAMLFLIIVRLGCYHEGRPRWPLVALALGPVAVYAVLMRFMVESTYIHTLLTLTFLLAVYYWVEGCSVPFLVFASFTLLTKGGVVLLAFMFAASFLVYRGEWRFAARSLVLLAVVALALAALVFALGQHTGSLEAWRQQSFGRDYGGRFSLLTSALAGQMENLKYVAQGAWRVTWQVALASCFLPLALLAFRKRDKVAVFCVLAALPYHLVICLSNPSWQHSSHVTHHLNYFVPTAPLLAIAGLRQLARCGRLMLACISAVALAAILACLWWSWGFVQRYESMYCRDIAPVHERHYAYAVGDYFTRRADAFSRQGNLDAMAGEAEKVLKLGYYRDVRDEHLDRQRAYAHHLIGCNQARRKEFEAAVTHLRKAIELDRNLVPAYISLAGCLLDTGERKAALEVIENGLKVAPQDTHLKALRTRAQAGG
ncbi:MAG: hypothetical protein FJ278_04585 [Planctomycetes bacterium]|nr:hypothetical protein [Planctomycetota bacterium]